MYHKSRKHLMRFPAKHHKPLDCFRDYRTHLVASFAATHRFPYLGKPQHENSPLRSCQCFWPAHYEVKSNLLTATQLAANVKEISDAWIFVISIESMRAQGNSSIPNCKRNYTKIKWNTFKMRCDSLIQLIWSMGGYLTTTSMDELKMLPEGRDSEISVNGE